MQEEIKKAKNKLKLTIGNAIKTRRLLSGKSISRISAEVLISKSVWRNIEEGKSDLRSTTLWIICEALETTPDELYIEVRQELGSEFTIANL